jgi:hypothetical protein
VRHNVTFLDSFFCPNEAVKAVGYLSVVVTRLEHGCAEDKINGERMFKGRANEWKLISQRNRVAIPSATRDGELQVSASETAVSMQGLEIGQEKIVQESK